MDDHANDAATATATAVGSLAVGAIEIPGDIDMFKVELTAGQTVSLQVTRAANGGAEGLDNPYLVFYDALASTVALDNDSGGGFDARMFVSVAASGTYYVGVRDHGQGVGTYELNIGQTSLRTGTDGADSISGGSASDAVTAGPGDDHLLGLDGDDLLDGGANFDIAQYEGPLSNFFIEPVDVSGWSQTASRGWVLSDSIGSEGIDTLVSIERVAFSDGFLALDLDGHAGDVAKVLGAVFGADAVYNPDYVGVGLQLVDSGLNMHQLAEVALAFRLGPQPSSAQVVELLFTNLVGAAPTYDQLQPLTALLDSGALTPTDLGVVAAEHELNLANIDFVGLSDYGIVYSA
jgi:hypothetical protein